MNREETLALWRQGKQAWNRHARGLMVERAALRRAGLWRLDPWENSAAGLNPESRDWLDRAAADFTDADFAALSAPPDPTDQPGRPEDPESVTDFSGWFFPGKTDFSRASFPGPLCLDRARFRGVTLFRNCAFAGKVSLERAQFGDFVAFCEARFAGEVDFNDAGLHVEILFEAAHFEQDASFSWKRMNGHINGYKARFGGNVTFQGRVRGWTDLMDVEIAGDLDCSDMHFSGSLLFNGARLAGEADFSGSVFRFPVRFEDTELASVDFSRALFCEETHFNGSRFQGPARFALIRSRHDFTLDGATFHQPPDFDGAAFAAIPSLLTVRLFPGQGSKPDSRPNSNLDPVACWHSLGGLARARGEAAPAVLCRKGEMLARRETGPQKDRGLPLLLNYGWGLLSDFGCSYRRPLVLWLVWNLLAAPGWMLLPGFVAPPASRTADRAADRAVTEATCSPLAASLRLTVNGALAGLPDALLTGAEGRREALLCLQGSPEAVQTSANRNFWLSLCQSLGSALLLALLFQALRNRWRRG